MYFQSTEEYAIYIGPVRDNNLLHGTATQAVCKAFHNNGPLLSAAPTLTHTRREKSQRSLGVPGGGRGAGHANDPSLDIWGELGWLLGQLGGVFQTQMGQIQPTHKKYLKYRSFKTDLQACKALDLKPILTAVNRFWQKVKS